MYTAQFTRGSQTLSIDGSTYRLRDGFAPPPVAWENQITAGALNRYGGGDLVSRRAADRTFTFEIICTGASEAQVIANVRRLVDFISSGGDTLYFEFSPFDLPSPLWGQFGALLDYEVVAADVSQITYPASSGIRARAQVVPVSLTVKPFALGNKQRLASALGGVWEDVIGAPDGKAKGLRIPEATTNKMTNMVFGNSTYNTDWTAAASLIEKKNTDPHYCFPGSPASPLLTAKASTNNTYTQSINAGNVNKHSLSAIVARPDGAAVDSNDVVIYYGSAQTTTFESLGSGLYLAYTDNINGVNAGTATGVQVKLGRSVYLLAFQMEEKTYHTPICFGDMLGCAWSGTVHASTSTRTAARVRLAVDSDTFVPGVWGVHLVWKTDFASTQAGDRYLFSGGATNIRAYFNATDDKFYLTDNTNTISSAAQSFTAGDVLDLVFVGGPSGLAIYKNGASIASGATYTPPAAPTYIYIGTDDSAANHAAGMFLLAEVYRDDLSSTVVSSLYSTISGALAQGTRVMPVPFLWNVDGDGIADNHLDSTHQNYTVAGGVPGTIPARTQYRIASAALVNNLWIGQHNDYGYWRNPSRHWYAEGAGLAQAGNSAGNYTEVSAVLPRPALTATPSLAIDLFGPVHAFARIAADSGTVAGSAGFWINTNNGSILASDTSISTTTTYKMFYLGALNLPQVDTISRDEYAITLNQNYQPAPATKLRVDFAMFIAGAVQRVQPTSTTIPGGGGAIAIPTWVDIDTGWGMYDNSSYAPNIIGELIELAPGAYNTLQTILADNAGTFDLTYSLTWTKLTVIPRWGLL